jgi:SAM-dependent methyltransferase
MQTQEKTIEKTQKTVSPKDIKIERGETQKDVNSTLLNELTHIIDQNEAIKVLDLPCGTGQFLNYIKLLYPKAKLHGIDIEKGLKTEGIEFVQSDLSRNFNMSEEEQFDLITSVSGVMMFENTKFFIENCSKRLKKGGKFILTNDNSATIIDRLSFIILGRTRQFRIIYENDEGLKQNLSIQYLVRIMRLNNIEIQKVTYTSFYPKDLIYLPIALLCAPFQYLYLKRVKTELPASLVKQMFSFKQYLYKHYILYGVKK